MGVHTRDARYLTQVLLVPEKAATVERLFESVGGWHGLYHVGAERLVSALGEERRPQVEALFLMVASWLRTEPLAKVINDPEALWDALRPRLAFEPVEGFWVVSLDTRSRLIGYEQVSMGTLNACVIHPREVFVSALQVRAASIVVVHNHPSGDPEPSLEDRVLTERLVSAGALLGIPVVDHLVIAKGGMRSILGEYSPELTAVTT